MEVVLVGIAGIAAVVAGLVLCGVHAVCPAGGFMRFAVLRIVNKIIERI